MMSPSTSSQTSTRIQQLAVASRNSPILYGLGMTGLMIITQAFNGYYMFYYVDHLGLVVTLASIINVIYAIWDAVNDPLVGYLSDNTRSRWGRRRPWLLAGLPFLLAFIILYFSVPNAFRQGMALFWYALIMLFLYETASTIMITNYTALFPELFQKFSIRARASAFTQGFGMGGELLGFSLAPILYNQFGFIGMALVISALTGILLIIPIAKVREDPRSQELSKFDMKEALRDVVRDKPFWHFTVVATLVLMTTGIMTLAIPFWAKYTLHASPKAPALIFFVGFGFAILTVAPWSKMVRKWGTKRMWVWAISIMILAAIENGFANTLLSGLIGALLTGVALGGVKVCREMLLALFVDRNLNRTGHRREGIYYSLTRFFARLSRIIESLSLVLLGVIFGYFSGESPGPHPENAFRFLMSVMPLIFLIPAWIMARRLPLGMEHEEAGA